MNQLPYTHDDWEQYKEFDDKLRELVKEFSDGPGDGANLLAPLLDFAFQIMDAYGLDRDRILAGCNKYLDAFYRHQEKDKEANS
jgi:predicted house-cleaning noncanonical NTP pyrophosphatase (MazG superfamily)